MILWLKIFHILSFTAWMAGLFYLPRLYVYHAESKVRSESSETFKIMERRLLRAITTPAMILTWIFGLWLAFEIGAFKEGWFHAKMFCVLLMSGFHGFLSAQRKKFDKDENQKSARFYRIINEIPTILLVFIVILVVLKPF